MTPGLFAAETALLLAARDMIRATAGMDSHECDIELDDQVPTLGRDTYAAIINGAVTAGERHRSSGTAIDARFAFRVQLLVGCSEVPRDRRRKIWSDRLSEMSVKLDAIIAAVDFRYELLDKATEYITATAAEGGRFPEPFKFASGDGRIQPVFSDPYNAAQSAGGDPILGVARSISFEGARFMKVR